MGFLSRFEGKMEDTFEGAADKMFDAPISPVQIAKKAEKQMRREKMVGAGKQYAPTLYTVLVNPDDDERLFGYYPTLAGETETYLVAKAAEEGLVMDGQPLVRFIVDDDLRHGKFDIIAEAVAAPIIAQLRQEEMQRYGLAPAAPGPAGGYGRPYDAPSAQTPQGYGTPGGAYGAPDPYGAPAGSPHAAPDPYAAPMQQPFAAPAAQPSAAGAYDPFEPSAQGAFDAKPPLPYVPEEEIDYSIDYGEYTFNSQDFDDYRENGASVAGRIDGQDPYGAADAARGTDYERYPSDPEDMLFSAGAPDPSGLPAAAVAAYGAGAQAPIAAAPMSSYPAQSPAPAPLGAPDTVVFAAGAGGANPTPAQGAARAYLVNTTENRTYALATARLLLGRESKNDIVVHDINASRTHAELRFEPQGVWTITDLGSTNGTLVNGAEISTAPLREGDVVTIGMTNLMFTLAPMR